MIHPHLDLVRQAHDTALPSRERKIREGVYHREKKGPRSPIRALSAVINEMKKDYFSSSSS
jgi:hypothetical protein